MPNEEPAEETGYRRELFAENYRELCTDAGNELYNTGMDLFDKFTDAERLKLSAGQFKMRLPKVVLCAVAPDLDRKFHAECILPAIRSAKRIYNNRP